MRKVYPLLTAPWQNLLQRRVVNPTDRRLISNTAILLSEKDSEPDPNNPLRRSLNIIGKDLKSMGNWFARLKPQTAKTSEQIEHENTTRDAELLLEKFQTHCDILIIGGGGVGSSIAYWLKEKARDGLNVVVVEKGDTYRKVPALQSFQGLSQQFSLPENIQMALFGADFMRGVKEHLDDVNLNFTPYGSLILATEENAEALKRSSKIQSELGVRNELLSQERLSKKFPWLNTQGIALGCHGLEREGWFDSLSLLIGYKKKALEYGAHFVEGELIDFEYQNQPNILIEGEKSEYYQALDKAVVRTHDGETRTIKFALCIIAAGSSSAEVARLARIGNSPGLLSIPLPVVPRERYSYVVDPQANDMSMFTTPLTMDPNGTYFRREGLSGRYLCGRNSSNLSTPMEEMNMEQSVFAAEIQPTLANRLHGFKSGKIESSWTDTYEYNTFDENGIIGPHPYYNNLYIAAGFNAHGIQQTPAIGRGMSELIVDGRYRTIDLTRLGFDRLIVDQPLYEVGAI